MTLINNINGLQNAENASGAPWFQVVRPEDVASIPDVMLDQISTAITLNGSANAYNIMATVGTVQWSETPQDVNGRLQYKSVFSFVIPKDRADVLNYAQHLNNRGVIAIVRDANGQNRLMGTVEEPATFRLSARTLGNPSGQRNEHRYEIVLNSPKPVPFYQVSTHLPAPAGTCAPVTEQVNGVDIGTSASGATNNQLIQDSAGASVGTAANPSIISDSTVSINSTTVGTVEAEGTINIPVELDAAPIGSWNGTAWDVGALYGTLITSVLQRKYAQNIMMAFSLVYINDNYTAAVINVRRSGDGATADFKPLEITDGTLTSWVIAGGGTKFGYVTKIYDQTGNEFALLNTNAAYQWEIVDAGNLIVDSQGKPTTRATSTQGWIIGSAALSLKQINFFTTSACSWAVLKVDASVGNAWFHSVGGSPSYARIGTGTFLNSQTAGTPITKVNNTVLADQNRDTLYAAMAGNEVIINTIDIDFTVSGVWSTSTQVKIGLSYPIGSTLSEFVLITTDNSANQDYVFENRNAFYNYY